MSLQNENIKERLRQKDLTTLSKIESEESAKCIHYSHDYSMTMKPVMQDLLEHTDSERKLLFWHDITVEQNYKKLHRHSIEFLIGQTLITAHMSFNVRIDVLCDHNAMTDLGIQCSSNTTSCAIVLFSKRCSITRTYKYGSNFDEEQVKKEMHDIIPCRFMRSEFENKFFYEFLHHNNIATLLAKFAESCDITDSIYARHVTDPNLETNFICHLLYDDLSVEADEDCPFIEVRNYIREEQVKLSQIKMTLMCEDWDDVALKNKLLKIPYIKCLYGKTKGKKFFRQEFRVL